MIFPASFSFLTVLICLCQSSSLKPIMLIPGLMASHLHGNVTRKPFWYCSNIHDDDVWVNDVLMIPPLHKCVLEYMGLQYHNDTDTITEKDGVSLTPVDFGGLDGIAYADELEHDLHFIPTYANMIEALKKRGYVERESLFGIPYDWRYGMAQTETFWDQVKNLIEEAYTKNCNQKVVLIGHSMGGIFINYFCTVKTTKEWRDKYIDSAFLVAPSIGGSFLAFAAILTKTIPFLSFLGELTDSAQKVGGVDIHIPNHEIFGDRPLFTDENGNNYAARDLKRSLKVTGIFDSDPSIEKIFELNEDYATHLPIPFDIPVSIVYNTALDTLVSLDRSNKKDKYSYGPGDLIVNGEGFEFMCNRWNTTYQVNCLNLANIHPAADHLSIVKDDETLNFLFKHLNDEKWKKLRNNSDLNKKKL